jgi:hypothetical protein
MDSIQVIFDALGKLTYAEMVELGCHLRDTYSTHSGDIYDARHWAVILEAARVGWPERDA